MLGAKCPRRGEENGRQRVLQIGLDAAISTLRKMPPEASRGVPEDRSV
jgi:hypothetical protein